jgi:hypothetical protein
LFFQKTVPFHFREQVIESLPKQLCQAQSALGEESLVCFYKEAKGSVLDPEE